MNMKVCLEQRTLQDQYPSRGALKAKFLDRLDPVVYTPNSKLAPIDENLVNHYEENGFLILEDVFDDMEVQVFQEELNRLRRDRQKNPTAETITEPGSGDVRSVFRIHQSSNVFKKLAEDRRLAGLAEYLLGDQVYVHQSRLNYKPGFRGKEFYWHSDFETWHVEDGMPAMRALSMSIALTDNHHTNGPLMLIPGSHKRYVVCEGQTPENHFKSSLKKQEYGIPGDACLNQLVDEGSIVSVTGNAGSVTVFDCNLMHGSSSNISPFPRSNAFIVYNAISNRVAAPFCPRPPRPEYICTRNGIAPLSIRETSQEHG